MDSATQDFFRSVEEHFVRRRGRPLLLSPADVRRVGEWHAAGIPLATVVEGIDIYFDRMERRGRAPRRAVTLAFVDDDVLDAWAGARHRRTGRATGTAATAAGTAPLAGTAEHGRLVTSLREAAARLDSTAAEERLVAAAVLAAAEKLATKHDIFDPAKEGHDDQRAEDHLRRIERSLMTAVREVVGAGGMALLEREAVDELLPKKAHMTEANYQRVLGQLVDKRLRQRFGLPRLSLFYS